MVNLKTSRTAIERMDQSPDRDDTRGALQTPDPTTKTLNPKPETRNYGSDHAEAHKYGVVRHFVGHGVGRTFHSGPAVLHYSKGMGGWEDAKGMGGL